MLALVEGNHWGWGSPEIIALLAIAVAGLAAFVDVERHPRRRWSTSTSSARARSSARASVAFIVSFAMLAMFFFLALYMQNIQGYSPLQAGVRFLPSTLVIIVWGRSPAAWPTGSARGSR